MNIHLIAVGRLRKGHLYETFKEYEKRLEWKLSLYELETANQKTECTAILGALKDNTKIIALDERGKSLPSRSFADTIQNWQNTGYANIQCIIGGADGLSDEIRNRADLLLSFGHQTWPHMLARIMLIEQLYRAQQILKNHPYHRD